MLRYHALILLGIFVTPQQTEKVRFRKSKSNKQVITAPEAGTPCKGEKKIVLGVTYCVPYVDKPATQAIRSGKQYEPMTRLKIQQYVQAICKEPGDVVTMGLFFGDFLPDMSKVAGANQRVWGLEPHPDNFQMARGTVYENAIQNAWIANAGGGETDGHFDMCIKNKNGSICGGQCGHNLRFCGESKSIPVVALDNLIPADRRVNVVHLDVEGMEFSILKGAKNLLQKWKPVVVLEGEPPEVVTFMTEIGYVKKEFDLYDMEANRFWLPASAA